MAFPTAPGSQADHIVVTAISFTAELVTFMTFQKYFLRISGQEDKAISHFKQNLVS